MVDGGIARLSALLGRVQFTKHRNVRGQQVIASVRGDRGMCCSAKKSCRVRALWRRGGDKKDNTCSHEGSRVMSWSFTTTRGSRSTKRELGIMHLRNHLRIGSLMRRLSVCAHMCRCYLCCATGGGDDRTGLHRSYSRLGQDRGRNQGDPGSKMS